MLGRERVVEERREKRVDPKVKFIYLHFDPVEVLTPLLSSFSNLVDTGHSHLFKGFMTLLWWVRMSLR